jgi:biotin synthase
MSDDIRHDWAHNEVKEIYELPLLELLHRSQNVHRQYHDPRKVQRCTLLSVKTGACPEDCKYCSQSSRWNTGLERESLMAVDNVLAAAKRAKEQGASRFCMGAAWRQAKKGKAFDEVLEMVRGVASLEMEVCVTLGMLDQEQAEQLKEAGLTAYNHNLDTSREFYPEVITSRTYDDRLDTIKNVQKAGISVCCGGILGLGETAQDRVSLITTLSNMTPHPESVPINKLVQVDGTPLEDAADLDIFELVRTIATVRILIPEARVRLSAGRLSLSKEGQAMCFLAGANSIFFGDSLLTTPNPQVDQDLQFLEELGLVTA